MPDTVVAPAAPQPTTTPNTAPKAGAPPAEPNGAAPQGGAAPEPKPAPRTWKVPYKGKEREVSEDAVPGMLTRAFGLDDLARDRAELRKKHEGLLERLKQDPWAVLAEHGVDPTELAKQRVISEFEREQMTPEQRRLMEAEEKLRQLTELRTKEEQERKQTQYQEEVQRERSRYENLFVEAAAKELGIEAGHPLAGAAMARMARIAHSLLDGEVEYTPEQIAQVATEELRGETQHALRSLKGESLLQYVGKDVAAEVVKALMAQMGRGTIPVVPAPGTPAAPGTNQSRDRAGRFAPAGFDTEVSRDGERERMTWQRMLG